MRTKTSITIESQRPFNPLASFCLIRWHALFILPVLLMLTPAFANAADWVKTGQSNGVSLYTRDVAGKNYKNAKGEVIVNVPFKNAVALIMVRELCPLWWNDLISVTTLEKNNPNFDLAYWHNRAPWPVSDRDVVTRSTVSQDPQTREVVFKAVATDQSLVPPHPKRVRITEMETRLRVLPLSANQTKITMEASIHPGGSIPTSMANSTADNLPKKSLQNIRKLLETPGKLDYKAMESNGFYRLNMPRFKF